MDAGHVGVFAKRLTMASWGWVDGCFVDGCCGSFGGGRVALVSPLASRSGNVVIRGLIRGGVFQARLRGAAGPQRRAAVVVMHRRRVGGVDGMQCTGDGEGWSARGRLFCKRARKSFWEVWVGGLGGLILIWGRRRTIINGWKKVLVAGTADPQTLDSVVLPPRGCARSRCGTLPE